MVPARARRALSCAYQVERVVQRGLDEARPGLLDTAKEQGLKLPTNLGVRRSHQRDADYQSSLALQLGNRFKHNPKDLASEIVANVHGNVIHEAFVSDKGFLNFVLQDEWLATQLVDMSTIGVTPETLDAADRRSILVDFCGPNLGKKLHVGHLRSSVIGDTISNLLEFRGHHVARISHTGDVGSALATLIAEILDSKVPLATLTDEQLGSSYEQGKKRFAQDAMFKARVDGIVLQLQSLGVEGKDRYVEKEVEEAWKAACQVSRQAYSSIFDRLNIRVEERGESTYLRLLPSLLDDLKKRGVAVESRGALCIFVNGREKPPMILQKQDGGYLYATNDLACLYSRLHGFPGVDDTKYDQVVYVTDKSQSLHFQQLFRAVGMAGWTSDSTKLEHAPFGLVLGRDGGKLSSRNGAFDYLEDLLDAVTKECSARSIASDDMEQNRIVGDAAVRYFELAQQRERDYKFIMDQVLHLKGNTGVYLLYASARLGGILRKVQTHRGLGSSTQWSDFVSLEAKGVLLDSCSAWTREERSLALLLCQFEDEVEASVAQLYPHYLCDYLFRVVGQFHAFYEECRVLGDPKEESRLVLCAATHSVLQRGLQLLDEYLGCFWHEALVEVELRYDYATPTARCDTSSMSTVRARTDSLAELDAIASRLQQQEDSQSELSEDEMRVVLEELWEVLLDAVFSSFDARLRAAELLYLLSQTNPDAVYIRKQDIRGARSLVSSSCQALDDLDASDRIQHDQVLTWLQFLLHTLIYSHSYMFAHVVNSHMYAGLLIKFLRLLSKCSTPIFATTTKLLAAFHAVEKNRGISTLVGQVLAEYKEGMQHFGGALLHVMNACGYPTAASDDIHLLNCIQILDDILQHPEASQVIFVNDFKVLLDLVVRECIDRPDVDIRRLDFLRLLETSLQSPLFYEAQSYRKKELLQILEDLLEVGSLQDTTMPACVREKLREILLTHIDRLD